jgi:hypothetical protein
MGERSRTRAHAFFDADRNAARIFRVLEALA